MFDLLLGALEKELHVALSTAVTGLVAAARTRLKGAVAEERANVLAEVAEERANGLAEVAKGLAEVTAKRGELHCEVEAMHKHKEAQEGRIVLNIGGYRFETSVQTLRRVPHTFFDTYFSGRYAQDVCNTAASSWTVTAGTLGTSWSTCAMAWCR